MNNYKVGDLIKFEISDYPNSDGSKGKIVTGIIETIDGNTLCCKDGDKNLFKINRNESKIALITRPAFTNFNDLRELKKKPLYGLGLFVRNDDFGFPVRVGDRVEVIRPEMIIEHEDNWSKQLTIPETIYTGVVVLLKSRGVLIKNSSTIGQTYIKAPLTNRSRNIWKWRKL